MSSKLKDANVAEAEAFLSAMGQAIFPSGAPTLAQATWSEAESRASSLKAGAPLDDRSSAEERLRAAEARFRTLVEQIPAVVFFAVLGEGKNEIYVSPHIEQMLGFAQQEWLEAPFLWFWQLHPDDRDLWNQEFTRGIRTGGPFKGECRFIARDGRTVWVHGEARLIKDDLGRPHMLQGVAFDITESKRAQEMMLHEATRTAKIEEELAIARRVQTSILPRNLNVEGLEIAAAMIPAEDVGGDYYDILPFEGGAWLTIGDVSGHGLDAGLVMLMVQSAMGSIARSTATTTPSQALITLNDVLFDNIRARLMQDDHVTLTVFHYLRDGKLTFAGAHEDLLLFRKATGKVEQIETPGSWVGATKDIKDATVETSLKLEPGDLLVLYTDGVTEAMNTQGDPFDLPRLVRAVEEARSESCEKIRDHVVARVRQWMASQNDDITLVVMRYQGTSRSHLTAAPDGAAVTPATRRLRFPVSSLFDRRTGLEALPELAHKAGLGFGLSARGQWEGTTLGLKLHGLGEEPDKTPLSEILHKAHSLALEREATVVELDLRELRFLSASCFQEMVSWLAGLNESPPERRYHVRFVANPFARWQQPSLSALFSFAPAVVLTET